MGDDVEMAETTWMLGHRPELDGLRGVAVLLVIGAHARVVGLAGDGYIGVEMFFALSGFLITALLLQERSTSGTVSLRGFYRRRALRLLPAVAALLVVVALFGDDPTRRAIIPAALYFANIANASNDLGGLTHTWSLSLEEQFYAVWPVAFAAVVALSRWVRPVVLVMAGAAALTLLRYIDDGMWGSVASRADAMLAGCAVGFAYRYGWRWPFPAWVAWLPIVSLLALEMPTGHPYRYAVGVTGAAWASALLVVAVASRPPRWLEGRALMEVGRRSYGLYLWHLPLLYALPTAAAWRAAAVALSFAAAWASYRWIEAPFLARKRPNSDAVDPPAVVLGGAADVVELDLERGVGDEVGDVGDREHVAAVGGAASVRRLVQDDGAVDRDAEPAVRPVDGTTDDLCATGRHVEQRVV